MRLRIIAAVALVLAVLPGSVAAQTSCTTFFANTDMPMTDCSGPSGTVDCTTYFAHSDMPMTDCSNTSYVVPPQAVYVAPPPPPQVVYVQAPRPGLDYLDGNGVPRWFAQGTFLKADDGQAIYAIWDQQFHPFQTWGSFLRHGGKADLSNVVRWSTLSKWPATSFGDPVAD